MDETSDPVSEEVETPPQRQRLTPALMAGALGMPYTPALEVIETPPELPVSTVRPGTVMEMIGQSEVRLQLLTMLQSALREGRQSEHCLFLGPPGLGKTTLAETIATFMGKKMIKTNAITLHSPTMLVRALQDLEDGDVLFIDEMQLITRKVAASLYSAMEDFTVDVPTGVGKEKTTITVDVARFTLVGATTEPGAIPQPLLDRFGFVGEVQYYTVHELAEIIERASGKSDTPFIVTPEAAKALALRARGTPRAALKMMRKARDVARTMQEAGDDGMFPQVTVDADLVESTFGLFNIDELGLTPQDRTVLRDLIVRHHGGPVGVKALTSTTGIDQRTIERMIEPMLIRLDLMSRGTNGRVATVAAYEHLGITPVPFDIRHQLR